jgi:hypothetical protein
MVRTDLRRRSPTDIHTNVTEGKYYVIFRKVGDYTDVSRIIKLRLFVTHRNFRTPYNRFMEEKSKGWWLNLDTDRTSLIALQKELGITTAAADAKRNGDASSRRSLYWRHQWPQHRHNIIDICAVKIKLYICVEWKTRIAAVALKTENKNRL